MIEIGIPVIIVSGLGIFLGLRCLTRLKSLKLSRMKILKNPRAIAWSKLRSLWFYRL